MTIKQAIQLWRLIRQDSISLKDIYESDIYKELGLLKEFWELNNARQVAQNLICDCMIDIHNKFD